MTPRRVITYTPEPVTRTRGNRCVTVGTSETRTVREESAQSRLSRGRPGGEEGAGQEAPRYRDHCIYQPILPRLPVEALGGGGQRALLPAAAAGRGTARKARGPRSYLPLHRHQRPPAPDLPEAPIHPKNHQRHGGRGPSPLSPPCGAGEEKGPEGPPREPAPPGTTVPRVKLLDTLVETFLQKLVAAGSYQRFSDCYKRLYQLQPEVTQRIYDKFITQLQASVRDEISELKAEGNLEAVLNALDKIVAEGEDHREPAWPCTENRRSWWLCSGSPSEEATAGPGAEGSCGRGPGL
ncbi:polyamine-modulated factor 1 [Crocuta crocuta]